MAKLKTPFLSMGASGTIADSLTFQKRGQQTIVRKKPVPTDPYSLAQAYQRWDYKDEAFRWLSLTPAQKQVWQTKASRYHITGFNLFLRQQLETLPDLALRLHLDEKSGALAYDSSKNKNNATINGASPATGLIAGALYLDGLNDQLVVTDHPTLDLTSPLTLEVFANLSVLTSQPLISKPYVSSTTACNYIMLINSSGKLQAGFGQDGLYRVKYTTQSITSGWHRYAAVIVSATDIKLYIDGVEKAGTYEGTATTLTKRAGNLCIGRFATWWTKGYLDEAPIYNRPCNATEILRHSERRYPA